MRSISQQILFSLMLLFIVSSCVEAPTETIDPVEKSSGEVGSSDSPKPSAPKILSVKKEETSFVVEFSHSGEEPLGGFSNIVNGQNFEDSNTNVGFKHTISGLDPLEKNCFKIQARFTQYEPELLIESSNELCVEVGPIAPVLVSAERNDEGVYVLSFTHIGPGPRGGFDNIVDGIDLRDSRTNRGYEHKLFGLDVYEKHCFKIQANFIQNDPALYLESNEICVDPKVNTPVVPVITSVTVDQGVVVIQFTQSGVQPLGGFDNIINNVDLNDFKTNSGLEHRLSGIDLGVRNCFQVQARFTQYEPKILLSSDEKCIEAMIVYPKILSYEAASVTSNAATISVTIDIDANVKVEYGIDATTLDKVISSQAPAKVHNLNLSALTPDTEFFYRPVASLQDGTQVAGEVKSFRTQKLSYTPVNPNGAIYYVTPTGKNTNDGKSELKAWRTLTYAASSSSPVKAGDIVYIKAGNYGAETVVVQKDGQSGKLITFEGYKEIPGDVLPLNTSYDYGDEFNSSVMPLLDGADRSNGKTAISISGMHYVALKNLQIRNYRYGITGSNVTNSIFHNVNTMYMGGINDGTPTGYGFNLRDSLNSKNNTVAGSLFVDGDGGCFRIEGDNNLIEKIHAYGGEGYNDKVPADYYIIINGGNNNTIRDVYLERVGNISHSGHGITLKYNCENNLIENATIVNLKGALEARHHGVKNNTFRDILITSNERSVSRYGTITIRDGASYNTFERIHVKNTTEGIRFYDQTESGQGGVIASYNTIKNSIFENVDIGIIATKASAVSPDGIVQNNTIANSTFSNVGTLFRANIKMDNTNTLINNILSDVDSHKANSKYTPAWVEQYNNYHGNGFSKPSGEGNISVDPKFVDKQASDFRLNEDSQCIDKGKRLQEVTSDFDQNVRPKGSSHDIGAFEIK